MTKLLSRIFSLIRDDNRQRKGRHIGRRRTMDDAITYRMRAGFPGDVSRSHPASVEPVLIDVNAPPTIYGQPVLVDATTQGVRPYAAGDQSDSTASRPYGFVVRPYPTQQQSTTNNGQVSPFTAAAPPTSGEVDVMREGYMMVATQGSPVKDGAVYVWAAATSGAHVQGGIEAAASSGNTTKLSGCRFNGPADANGVAEISVNFSA